MTVADMIEKLKEFPITSEIGCKQMGNKIVIVAKDHELDPICQIKQSGEAP